MAVEHIPPGSTSPAGHDRDCPETAVAIDPGSFTPRRTASRVTGAALAGGTERSTTAVVATGTANAQVGRRSRRVMVSTTLGCYKARLDFVPFGPYDFFNAIERKWVGSTSSPSILADGRPMARG